MLTALAVNVPLSDIPDVLLFGFAGTLGEVALLVGFGVMIGRLLEVSGGAQVLADTLIGRFGEKRAPLALGVASLLFGFPIFFDVVLVVFLPIILTVARPLRRTAALGRGTLIVTLSEQLAFLESADLMDLGRVGAGPSWRG